MPKLKTHRGAAKRFKKAAKGQFRRRCANRNHILTKKSVKRKRHLRGAGYLARVAAHNLESVKRMLAG